MIGLGFKYVKIFKKTYFHPFITLKPAYKQLSIDRQSYSNKIIKFLNLEVELIGKLPTKNKILYVINHRSLLDIIVMENIFSKFDKNGTWIAKEELFTAIYGEFFKYSGCISVDIDNKKGLLSFFKKIKKTLLKVDDFNIYIFPEGERNKDKGILQFQSGAQKISRANKLDIVPIFIDEKLEQVFKKAPYKDKKIIKVYVGDFIQHSALESQYLDFVYKIKRGLL